MQGGKGALEVTWPPPVVITEKCNRLSFCFLEEKFEVFGHRLLWLLKEISDRQVFELSAYFF
jgi:hypothetical protein